MNGLLMTSASPEEARSNSAAFSIPFGVDTSTFTYSAPAGTLILCSVYKTRDENEFVRKREREMSDIPAANR